MGGACPWVPYASVTERGPGASLVSSGGRLEDREEAIEVLRDLGALASLPLCGLGLPLRYMGDRVGPAMGQGRS